MPWSSMLWLVLAGALHAQEAQPLGEPVYHLGRADEPEWRDLASPAVHGPSLSLTFEAKANATPATLLLRQSDVKEVWPVLLNGQRIGQLTRHEVPQECYVTIPAGALRNGDNTLSILPPPQLDDAYVRDLRLISKPPEEALRGSRLQVRVREVGSGPEGLPCKLTLVNARGELAALVPPPPDGTTVYRPGVVYTAKGTAEIEVAPGAYTLYATRGPEYGLARQAVQLSAGQTATVVLQLRREVATPGLIACDPHIHTFTLSRHGDATIDERLVTLAAEGVELAVASDHNVYADYGVSPLLLSLRRYFTWVTGCEVTTKGGHFIAFPVADRSAPIPDVKQTDWSMLLPAIRRIPGNEIAVLNHPRDRHGNIPFAPENFHPITGDHHLGPEFTFDAMEVCNSGALQSDFMQNFRDWFALLNHGYRITAVGTSDSHDVSRFIVGQGRTLIATSDADPSQVDVPHACRQLKAGRAYVSMGLFTRLTVGGQFQAGDVATGQPAQVPVVIEVQGPSWVQASRVVLYANGAPIFERDIAPTPAAVKAKLEFTIPKPTHDVHLVAIAHGPPVTEAYWFIPWPYQPTGKSRQNQVLGANNPIYLDADGDGQYTAPRHYAKRLAEAASFNPAKLLPALADFDAATAAQAASLCAAQGANLYTTEWQTALTQAAEPVRQGFRAYLDNSPTKP